MPPRRSEISENTMLPLSMVAGVVVVLLGGAAWLTNLNFTTIANAQKLEEISSKADLKDDAFVKKMDAVAIDVSQMRGQISIILEMMKAERRRNR